MSLQNSVARRAWLPLVLMALAGCGPSEEVRQKLNELAVATAQRDSLLLEVADNARLMSEISAELAAVRIEGDRLVVGAESPIQARRDSLLETIKYVTARVENTEGRLRQSRARIRALSALSDSLRGTLEETISNYESVIDAQRETIAQLTEQLEALHAENAQLVAQVDTLEAETNTVFYVIGTKDELLEQGIVRKEGGARFLFIFGKRGETLVPARELDHSAFTSINRREVTEIELPAAEEEYKIVSRQDVTYLETPPDEKGRVYGNLRITSPDEFWSVSKYLIIVQG
jgi:cell division protein FtsB